MMIVSLRNETFSTSATILLLSMLLCYILNGVNGQYSSYKEHAKQQLQQQQYASILRSATIGQKINGNERTGRTPINGVNRLQSVEQESTLMRRGKTILDSDNNPNLDVGLLDVEPEANLFLDEISIKNLPKWSHNPKSGTHIVPHAIKSGGEVDRLSNNQESTAIDTRHLALVHSTNSVVVRATYGPFTVRQTINPFSATRNDTNGEAANTPSGEPKKSSIQLKSHSEQITAYLVTKEVRRSHPVLRVLFYASHLAEFRTHQPTVPIEEDKTLCAAVIVQYQGERLFGTCSPSKTRQNACLAEVTIPALYWPPLDVSNGGIYAAKQQKSSSAKVYYTIAHTEQSQQCNDQNFLSLLASSTSDGDEAVSDLSNAENSMNLIYLNDVSLVPFRGSYEEVTNDNVVTVLIPQEPIYPNSKIYIPVKYTYNPDYPVSAFSLRVQVKPGLKILGAQLSHPNKLWQLSVELGAKQTTATVTAFLRDLDQNSQQQDSQSLPDELLENMSQEVYSWLIEIEENIDITEVNGRIVWQLLYNTDSSISIGKQFDMQQQQSQQQQEDEDFEKESVKLTSLVDIQKDVVQEILAITKSRELLNTAILNGRQVSRTMRIYQVSAAGSINDITFQCSCQSADESIIKVSPSCTSVYLDGSEVRGSQNATVIIKYGSFTGFGSMIVWMPLIPLDVRISDTKLSQIKGWRVPSYSKRTNSYADFVDNSEGITNDKRFGLMSQQMLLDEGINESDKYWSGTESGSVPSENNPFGNSCRLRFQQARVEVYTRFLSTDHNSGREASLLNRRHSLRITHLVRNLIRVTDSKVIRMRGNQVEGVGVGRADVEIMSPLTGSVIGSKEVRVTMDREMITRLEVRPVSGIKLRVEPFDSNTHNIWTVQTELASKLSKQYQEAILDTRIIFSDQTWLSLSEVAPIEYDLSVDTFKGVVAYVSRVASGYSTHQMESNSPFGHEIPRIIALAPGQGELVHLTLDLPYACQRKKSQPLASTYVDIDVDFQLPDTASSLSLQNDAIIYRRFGNNYARQYGNNQTGLKMKESFRVLGTLDSKKRTNQMGGYRTEIGGDRITYQRHSTTPSGGGSNLEFGIYSLLAIVTIASIIVVALYSVFSFRFRHRSPSSSQPHVTTTTITDSRRHGTKSAGTSKRLHNFPPFWSCVNYDVQISVSNAKEWVWVSKDQFENGLTGWNGQKPNEQIEQQMQEVRRPLLLPVCDHNGNITHLEQNQITPGNSKREEESLNAQPTRISTVSDSNFRITSNPTEMFPENGKYDLQSNDCMHALANRLSTNSSQRSTSKRAHEVGSRSGNGSIDLSSVLIPPSHKSTRIATNPGLTFMTSGECPPPPIPSRTRHIPSRRSVPSSTTSHISRSLKWTDISGRVPISDEKSSNRMAPPIPPHRVKLNDDSWMESSSPLIKSHTQPPPIPPHRNQMQPKLPSGHSRTQPSRPKHLRLNMRNTPQNDDQCDTKLDYHSMIKVLDRLKESNA